MAGFPNIAVVDDEKAIVDILGYSLKKKFPDAEIVGFSQANEAWDWLTLNRVDLLLTDLNMPEMSGQEIISMMQQTAPDTPVFVISGALEPVELKQLEIRYQNVRGFSKPLLAGELIAGIEEEIAKNYEISDKKMLKLKLLNLFQLLHLQHKSVQVNVTHPNGTGYIIFQNGEPVVIEFDGEASETGFFKMLLLEDPEVKIVTAKPIENSQILMTFSQLLSEYVRLRDDSSS